MARAHVDSTRPKPPPLEPVTGPARTLDRRPRSWRWVVAAGIAVAVLVIAAWVLVSLPPRGVRVPVVGAGALARLGTASTGYRYDLRARERESFEETHARITDAIAEWPDVIVLGLDARALAGGAAAEDAGRATMLRIVQQAENATAVPVVLGFVPPEGADPALRAAIERVNAWWRVDVCRVPGRLRLCVEVEREADVPAAIAAALPDAFSRHEELEASTQVGR